MLGFWIRFGKSTEDKVNVLREDGGEGGLISVCAPGKDGRRARAKKEVRYKIQGMCSAKAHTSIPCLGRRN